MDTNDLDWCVECGVLYNKEIVCNKESRWNSSYYTKTYDGNCPVCKAEVSDDR